MDNRTERFDPINILLVVILIAAAFIRLFEIGSFSLSNDELSAIVRADQSSFIDLIQNGVIATDPHPAGVQIFLFYYLKIFNSPLMIRLPFVLLSSLSLFVFFHLFKNWIGRNKAVMVIALFAFMEFVVIQSQLARPYAFGLFSMSLYLWSWNELVIENRKSRIAIIVFIVSGALNCYIHYYAALFTAVVGGLGLVFAHRGKSLKTYLLLSSISVLLFLPHLGVTLDQLSRGPLTNWIDPAGPTFIWKHIWLLLNKSEGLVVAYSAFFLLGIYFLSTGKVKDKRPFFISLIFFLTPIFIGHLYSVLFGSALMDRVLLFSCPFFYLLPFTALPDVRKKVAIPITGLILFLSITTTLMSRTFLSRQYVENFSAIANDLNEARMNDGDVLMLGNYNSPEYVNFYLKNEPVEFDEIDISGDTNQARVMAAIRNSNAQHLSLSWSCKATPSSIVEYAREYFPHENYHRKYYNGGVWSMSKSSASSEVEWLEVYPDVWLFSDMEFLDVKEGSFGNKSSNGISINVSAVFEGADLDEVYLVFAVKENGDYPGHWEGHRLSDFAEHGNEIFIHCKEFPFPYFGMFNYNIYFWNPGKKEVMLSDVKISSQLEKRNYSDLY